MKLNEAVSRVLTMPVLTGSAANAPDVWKAKKPIPIGRAKKYTVLFETYVCFCFDSVGGGADRVPIAS